MRACIERGPKGAKKAWLFLPINSLSAVSLKVSQSLLPQHESLLLHPAVLEPDLHLLVAEV